jgi:hypothetical protein
MVIPPFGAVSYHIQAEQAPEVRRFFVPYSFFWILTREFLIVGFDLAIPRRYKTGI